MSRDGRVAALRVKGRWVAPLRVKDIIFEASEAPTRPLTGSEATHSSLDTAKRKKTAGFFTRPFFRASDSRRQGLTTIAVWPSPLGPEAWMTRSVMIFVPVLV